VGTCSYLPLTDVMALRPFGWVTSSSKMSPNVIETADRSRHVGMLSPQRSSVCVTPDARRRTHAIAPSSDRHCTNGESPAISLPRSCGFPYTSSYAAIHTTIGRDHRLNEGHVALSMPRAAWHIDVAQAMRFDFLSKEALSSE
jgi:hypothetical protein